MYNGGLDVPASSDNTNWRTDRNAPNVARSALVLVQDTYALSLCRMEGVQIPLEERLA